MSFDLFDHDLPALSAAIGSLDDKEMLALMNSDSTDLIYRALQDSSELPLTDQSAMGNMSVDANSSSSIELATAQEMMGGQV